MKNILVVEDDKLTLDFYRIILNRSGYNPVIIEDGDKVLELLKTEKVSLIIMDINLKNTYLKGEKIDGLKLSSLIKKDENLANIPLILVSAYTREILEKKIDYENKADYILTKPIQDFNLLLNLINRLAIN